MHLMLVMYEEACRRGGEYFEGYVLAYTQTPIEGRSRSHNRDSYMDMEKKNYIQREYVE